MRTPSKKFLLPLLAVVVLPVLVAEEKVDLAIVNRIRAEAFSESKVMETMFYLTDVYGPRLTNSPNYKTAGDWAVKRLQEFGLVKVREEKWGPFGRGWANKYFEAHMQEPQFASLNGIPLAWTSGTQGSLTGEAILAPLASEADLDKYKGKLKGKVVLMTAPRELPFPTTAEARRYSSSDLSSEENAPDPGRAGPFAASAPGNAGRRGGPTSREERRKLQEKIAQFLKDEGAVLTISESANGDGGTIFAAAGGTYDPKKPVALPGVTLMPEHYNRIARLLEHNIPVKLEFNIKNEFYDENQDCFNIVGEIPGTGPHKDELVMLGAHFDSWHGGTGATDNGAGSAVMMEAARILKAANLPLDRTVRIALWGGEEEGLLGSRAYVKEHFGDRETMKLTAEHAKVSGYFNYDNGTGKIRGVYLQGNDMMRPIFESWLAPFKDTGAAAISIRNTGGTDHLSYDAVGLPGFQFIQDPMDYETRTHHSNMDTYDRIQPGDLMQASAVIASFVYNTANRPEMLPRKPLPKPQPQPDAHPSTEPHEPSPAHNVGPTANR
jgi:carboxypeptidase Q